MIRDLWYIVNSVKGDLGMDANTHDLKLFKYAIDTYRDLTLANLVKNSIKTLRLPIVHDLVTKQGYTELPDDFVDYYKIGLCIGGYIINLDANDNICIAQPVLDCCGDELATCIQNTVDACGCGDRFPGALGYPYMTYYDYFPYWHNGQFIAGQYGRSAHRYKGGFRIDFQLKRIVFDRCVRADAVILEYKSEGFTDGNAIVPYDLVDCMRFGVHWQRSMFSTDKLERMNEQMMGKRYRKHVLRANARINSMTVSEIMAIYRSSISQTPKR